MYGGDGVERGRISVRLRGDRAEASSQEVLEYNSEDQNIDRSTDGIFTAYRDEYFNYGIQNRNFRRYSSTSYSGGARRFSRRRSFEEGFLAIGVHQT